jgi:hypothetical protein
VHKIIKIFYFYQTYDDASLVKKKPSGMFPNYFFLILENAGFNIALMGESGVT